MTEKATATNESFTGWIARSTGQSSPVARSQQVQNFVAAARAPATLQAYRCDWAHFVDWCEHRDISPLPAAPENVAAYLADLAEHYKPSTIQRRLSTISQAHKAADLTSPVDEAIVRETHRGIRRTLGTKPESATALRLTDLQRLVTAIPSETITGIRDHALILVGFWGALRRCELVGLDVADIEFRPEGVALTIRSSKTDQEGASHLVGLPNHQRLNLDPVAAVRTWLDRSGIIAGPAFRSVNRHGQIDSKRLSGQSVNLILKNYATAAGITGNISGHSLRAGFATAAAEAGVNERLIISQTRHESLITVRRYIRDGGLFTHNAALALMTAGPDLREEPI